MEWMDVPGPGLTLEQAFEAWLAGFLAFSVTAAGIAAVAIVGIALGYWLAAAGVRRRLWCDTAGRVVDVDFRTRGLRRRHLDVVRCSAFADGAPITCARRCCL